MQRTSHAALKQRRPREKVPFKVFGVQVLAGVAIVFSALPLGAVPSALSGVLVSLIPCFYFALRFSRVYSTQKASDAVGLMYRAEAGKFGLTVALFSLVFALMPPSTPAFFFFAYIATTLVQWAAPWLLRTVFRSRI